MKTLSILALLAALVAFAFLPIRFEIGASLLFAAGFVAIALRDYGRSLQPIRLVATPVRVVAGRKERFGLAA